MNNKQAERLGAHLKKARAQQGIGTWRLADASGLKQVTVLRIERGEFLNPDPDKLVAIAEALDLDAADVLTRAGYPVPTDLLTMSAYLRGKYRKVLSGEQLDQLEADVLKVLKRYGIDPITELVRDAAEAVVPPPGLQAKGGVS